MHGFLCNVAAMRSCGAVYRSVHEPVLLAAYQPDAVDNEGSHSGSCGLGMDER